MIKPRKSLGQNFLIDQNIIRKIIDVFNPFPGDLVLEIGPGTGALTEHLLKSDLKLYAIELDERAFSYLNERYPNYKHNYFKLYNEDILEFDLKRIPDLAFGEKLNVIGNIPYNLSSEIFFWLFNNREVINKAQLMIQREVGQRLNAKVRTKNYGILTIAMELSGYCRHLFDVSPNCFNPVPKVTSSIIEMSFNSKISKQDFDGIMKIVRQAFNQRRKTLRNSLSAFLSSFGDYTSDFIIKAESELTRDIFTKRPEELTSDEFALLYKLSVEIKNQ